MSDTEREAVARDSLPIMSDSARGFAAMFRAGAYDPDDAEMVAKKFEELGAALDAHDAERAGDAEGSVAAVANAGSEAARWQRIAAKLGDELDRERNQHSARIAAAVMAERERCAQECDQIARRIGAQDDKQWTASAECCAAAIRAGAPGHE